MFHEHATNEYVQGAGATDTGAAGAPICNQPFAHADTDQLAAHQ